MCRKEVSPQLKLLAPNKRHDYWRVSIIFLLVSVLVGSITNTAWAFWIGPVNNETRFIATDLTLRKVLLQAAETDNAGFHLAMAPAFFGFYGYFGALSAWEEAVDPHIFQSNLLQPASRQRIYSVAGASAGAMAAVLLSSGVSPRAAARFCSNVTLSQFADFPGVLGVFRGNMVQQLMHEFIRSERPHQSLLLEDGLLPVAVSGFDLQTMRGKILTRGRMARAARASATFPLLFQPVGWRDDTKEYTLIDGGIGDWNGWKGLAGFVHEKRSKGRQRVVHMQMSSATNAAPMGPSDFIRESMAALDNDNHESHEMADVEVISISLGNLPQCGPWAMEKGPVAVEAARQAMIAALDTPLHRRKGSEEHHYEINIDTSAFW